MQCGIGFGKEKGVVSEVGNAGSFRAGRCVEQDLGNRGEWMYGQSAGLRIRVITGQNQVGFSIGQQIGQFRFRVNSSRTGVSRAAAADWILSRKYAGSTSSGYAIRMVDFPSFF